MEFKVVGVTQDNRQETIRKVIESYVNKDKPKAWENTLKSWDGMSDAELLDEYEEGSEFEGQKLIGAATLERDPNNKHDPKAIKVMLDDASGGKHHVGFIAKEDQDRVSKGRVDVEFVGGNIKTIHEDDDNNEFINDETLTTGIRLTIVSTKDVMTGKQGNSPKVRKLNLIMVCIILGVIAFMFLLLVII